MHEQLYNSQIYSPILTCAGAGRPACLLCIQRRFQAARGKAKCFPLPLGEPVQSQWGYLDPCHLWRWGKSEQPETAREQGQDLA